MPFLTKAGLRINRYARVELLDGTVSTDLYDHKDKWADNEIEEQVEPAAPTDFPEYFNLEDFYTGSEDDAAPWVRYARKTNEEIAAGIIRKYEGALDAHMDKVAREYRYDNRWTFSLRAGYPGPWQAEGIKFAQWMDACNAQAYALMQQLIADDALPPSVDDFLASLPEFTLEG